MTTKNKQVRFMAAEKNALSTGQEMTDGEIIWRKLADGTGVGRYDFKMKGRRYKGTLGKEKDGVTLSQARAEYARVQVQETLEAPTHKRPSHKSNLLKGSDVFQWLSEDESCLLKSDFPNEFADARLDRPISFSTSYASRTG